MTNHPLARARRGEPLTDTQLLMTITICIFVCMYLLAMAIWGGGFLRVQQLFDMLNNNAALIVVACSLTVVMIGGGIDISVGGVTALVVMSCVTHKGTRRRFWRWVSAWLSVLRRAF